MYTIDYCDFGPFTLVELSNQETGELFSFFPGFGACMNQLILKGKNGINYKLLRSNDDYESLITEGKQRFVGSKLFPFPNRVNAGTYVFASEEYQLPINFPSEGHAIHGLLLESPFKVKDVLLSEEEGQVTLENLYDNEHPGYPFKFRLEVEYALSKKGFACTTRVANIDQLPIPVGDGWHPYFRIGDRINDLYLCIPTKEEVEVNESMIPNGRSKSFNDFCEFKKIGEREFDTCFKLAEGAEISTVQLWDQEEDIRLNIWMESGRDNYQYVQVYTPPARDCIAIEPMTCMPDAFNNQKGLIVIPPGGLKSFQWGINLS